MLTAIDLLMVTVAGGLGARLGDLGARAWKHYLRRNAFQVVLDCGHQRWDKSHMIAIAKRRPTPSGYDDARVMVDRCERCELRRAIVFNYQDQEQGRWYFREEP